MQILFSSLVQQIHILDLLKKELKKKKTIFCEKLLDLNINKIIKTYKRIKRTKPKIQLGFNRRYDPGHYSLKKDLDKK